MRLLRARRPGIKNVAQIRKTNIDSINNEILFGQSNSIGYQKSVPYGKNDLYPNDILLTLEGSPTGQGCRNRKNDFVFGLGVEGGDDIVINRHGETVNDIMNKTVFAQNSLSGYSLHFNFNSFGQITEIQYIQIEFVRFREDFQTIFFGKPKFGSLKRVEFPLYNTRDFRKRVKLIEGGIKKYTGEVYYFKTTGDIYPRAPIDAALMSAKLENSVQIYGYANIENGFNSSGAFKIPSMVKGKSAVKKMIAKLEKIKGAKNAGGIVVIDAPLDLEGKQGTQKLFEPFTLNSVDNMYTNQNETAEKNILKVYTMPQILLGTSDDGMFNKAEFQDAAQYFNNDTEKDRQIMEGSWMKWWDNTIFKSQLSEIKLIPLETDPETDPDPDENKNKKIEEEE